MNNLPKGVFSASITPLHDDLSVNYVELVDHCKWLLANGSNGIALLGTTGEANSFSLDERMKIMQAVGEAGLPVNRIMVGTGCCALPDTLELTKYALSLGYGGILLLPPFYYKPVTDQGLLTYMRQLIQGVDDERLRIYLYHIPQVTGVPYSIELTKQLVDEFPAQVVGMKDSSGDFNNMRQLCEEIPGFQLYAGTEKYLLDVLKIGGMGCISATANATTQMAAKVFRAWENELEAESLQEALTNARVCFEGLNFVSALKSIFVPWHDGDSSWRNMRAPNIPLSETQLSELMARLDQINFVIE